MPDASPAISQILPCWFPKLGLPLFLAPLIMAAMRNYAGGRFCLALLHYSPPSNGATKKEGPLFYLALLHYPPHPCKKSVAEFSLSPYAFATFHLLNNIYIQSSKFETGSFKFLYAAEICSIGFIPINPSTAGCLQRKSDKVTWVCLNLFFQTT